MKKVLYSTAVCLLLLLCPYLNANLIEFIPDKVKFDVVHINQNDKKSCATTSVAMAISYYENLNDNPLNKETVWKISGSNEYITCTYGADMNGLKRITDYYGYKGKFAENMNITDIENLLSQGILIMLNIREIKNDFFDRPLNFPSHAVLVVGYDKNKKILYINDPANKQNKVLSYYDLENRWSAHLSSPKYMLFHNSGFIIYPK